jgi:hypothetical protein
VGQGGGTLYFKIESSILGSLHSFNIFQVMGQSNWLIAKEKEKEKTWEAPHLINRRAYLLLTVRFWVRVDSGKEKRAVLKYC